MVLFGAIFKSMNTSGVNIQFNRAVNQWLCVTV